MAVLSARLPAGPLEHSAYHPSAGSGPASADHVDWLAVREKPIRYSFRTVLERRGGVLPAWRFREYLFDERGGWRVGSSIRCAAGVWLYGGARLRRQAAGGQAGRPCRTRPSHRTADWGFRRECSGVYFAPEYAVSVRASYGWR